jgi:hypothetical protein
MTEIVVRTQIASRTAVLVSSARFQRFNGVTIGGKTIWSIMIEAQSGVRRWSHICQMEKKNKRSTFF